MHGGEKEAGGDTEISIVTSTSKGSAAGKVMLSSLGVRGVTRAI